MFDDWKLWAALAIIFILAVFLLSNVLSLFRSISGSHRDVLGPIDHVLNIAALAGIMFMSASVFALRFKGIQLPWPIPTSMMVIGIALVILSSLARPIVPWLRTNRQRLPHALRWLADQ